MRRSLFLRAIWANVKILQLSRQNSAQVQSETILVKLNGKFFAKHYVPATFY